ncbi:hypothetical protein MNBD_BACTEROID03-775 [hydrothermal vent metagenome]|uniref:Uncharacterized protein n=1 Tax=hydrothermal vent metagenome TaxID=652676 RepID=A0A3B0U6T3_9ZZZZ
MNNLIYLKTMNYERIGTILKQIFKHETIY